MFGFTKLEREVYKSTFLRKVIINIEFASVQNLKEKSQDIVDLFKGEFPRIALGKNKGFQISLGGNDRNPDFKTINENDNISLKTEDGQTELLINCDKVTFSVEGKTYECYEKNIRSVLQKIVSLFQIINVNKLKGCNLRKINLIEFGYDEEKMPNGILNALLNDSLVYNEDSFPDVGKITQNIHNVEFKEGEYLLNLKYGMNTLPIPNKKIGQLIVDYNIQSNVLLARDSISNEIKILNQELFNVFSWIFNEESKTILRNGTNK